MYIEIILLLIFIAVLVFMMHKALGNKEYNRDNQSDYSDNNIKHKDSEIIVSEAKIDNNLSAVNNYIKLSEKIAFLDSYLQGFNHESFLAKVGKVYNYLYKVIVHDQCSHEELNHLISEEAFLYFKKKIIQQQKLVILMCDISDIYVDNEIIYINTVIIYEYNKEQVRCNILFCREINHIYDNRWFIDSINI